MREQAFAVRRWAKWQGPAIRDRERGRKDDRKVLRLSWVSVSTDLESDPAFLRFAELVGGRSAETFLTRILTYLGVHAARTGVLPGIHAGNFDQVLSRRHDTVKKETARKVFAALLESGLCEASTARAEDPEGVTGGYTDPCTPPGTTPAPPREGPTEEGQGVTEVSCIKNCAIPTPQEVDVESSQRPVVDSGVAVDRPAPAAAISGSPERCTSCTDGALVDAGRMRCCTCSRGRERALNQKRGADADRAHAARVHAARGRQGRSEPLASILQRIQEKSRVLRLGVRDPVPAEAASAS